MVTTTGQVAPSIFSAPTRLRRQLEDTKDLIVCPGVYDGFSARIAMQVGFDALYMTGAGTNASRLGMADLGYAHLHDMRANAEMIANLDPNGPPIIADMDTGYGGTLMVARSTDEYIRAGVAGFHIEDQVLQKRCGHLGGKEVVSADVYISRIRAAIAARERRQSDIVIIARTDALQPLGYDECIRRLRAARAEGADAGLLEGFTTKEEARRAVKDLEGWPLMINMVENAVTPLMTVDECREMGFRIMNFSFACLAAAYTGIHTMLQHLKTHGVTGQTPSLYATNTTTAVTTTTTNTRADEYAMVQRRKYPTRISPAAHLPSPYDSGASDSEIESDSPAIKRVKTTAQSDAIEDYMVWIKRRASQVTAAATPAAEESSAKDIKIGPKFMFDVCGMQESMRIDAAAGGAAFAKGVDI